MTRESYLEQRTQLLNSAQSLIDAGKLEDAAAKAAEVERLDAAFEAESVARANLSALTDKPIPAPAAAAPLELADVTPAAADIYDSAEYKAAFQAFVANQTPIPAKFRNQDANTKTTDVAAMIPTSTLQKIYEESERIGVILPLVTRTSFQGGLVVPTSATKPSASWVNEGAGSDRQKKTTPPLTFVYHKLRCEISMSYEVAVLSYPVFEATFVRNVADALVKAKEIAILSGNGTGKPKGILAETPGTGKVITVAATGLTYANLLAAEGLEEHEDAVWIMTKATYMTCVEGLVDTAKQPIARVNYGLSGKPEYYIFGRRVILVPGSYMDTWVSGIAANKIVAFLFDMQDYILNEPAPLTTKWFDDDDTDDRCLKAIELVDGKCALTDSLITFKTAAAG